MELKNKKEIKQSFQKLHKKLGCWSWFVYLIVLGFVIYQLFTFLPFLFGSFLIYFMNKNIKYENKKWLYITAVAIVTLMFGFLWAKGFTTENKECNVNTSNVVINEKKI